MGCAVRSPRTCSPKDHRCGDVELQLRHADLGVTMRFDQAKNSLARAAGLPYASAQYGMLSAD